MYFILFRFSQRITKHDEGSNVKAETVKRKIKAIKKCDQNYKEKITNNKNSNQKTEKNVT